MNGMPESIVSVTCLFDDKHYAAPIKEPNHKVSCADFA